MDTLDQERTKTLSNYMLVSGGPAIEEPSEQRVFALSAIVRGGLL